MKKVIKLTESDLVRIIKKIISEQPFSLMGAADLIAPSRTGAVSRLDLSKGPKNSSSGRTPKTELDSYKKSCENPIPHKNFVKNYFTYCQNNKSKYSGSLNSTQRYLIQDLHKSMEGIFSTGTLNLLEKINSLSDFCKIANNFNFENSENPGKNDLYSWLDDENSIQWVDVAEILKKFNKESGISDCFDEPKTYRS
jgi:hypothetical protein